MQRRRILAILGGASAVSIGGYGTYDAVSDGGESPDRSVSNVGSGARPDATQPDEPIEDRDGHVLRGITPSDYQATHLDAFEEWLNRKHAIVVCYFDMLVAPESIRWAVREQLTAIWERGAVPLVMWQPQSGGDTAETINRDIADGDYDDLLDIWVDELADWMHREGNVPDRRCYLNLAPEMNGDWSPWSPAVGNETETDFVDMWHHVYDLASAAGIAATHARWMWTLDTTTRGVDPAACYPGDDYVDWLAMHGYNWASWGGWRSAAEHCTDLLTTLRSIADKPIALTEFGTSSEVADGYDPSRKDQWIEDAFGFIEDSDIRMACWFNITDETDWGVFGSERGTDTVTIEGETYPVYEAYRTAVSQDGVLGPHPDHPRILTDAEFAGEF